MSKKLKPVPAKTSFAEYTKAFKYQSDRLGALKAYVDCMPEHVDTDGIERNLNYFSPNGMSIAGAKMLMSLACPGGYNGFEVESAFKQIAEVFGNGSLVFIARESSVCLYIKPEGTVWVNDRGTVGDTADEVSYVGDLGMFRLWWD